MPSLLSVSTRRSADASPFCVARRRGRADDDARLLAACGGSDEPESGGAASSEPVTLKVGVLPIARSRAALPRHGPGLLQGREPDDRARGRRGRRRGRARGHVRRQPDRLLQRHLDDERARRRTCR